MLSTIFKGAGILAISSLLSRILGVFRDHLLAKNFGAGDLLDTYYAAFAIPDLLYGLIIMSVVTTIFLPLFQKYKENNQWEEAWQFSSAVFNTLFIILTLIVIIIFILTPHIVSVYTSQFTAEQMELTTTMIRIMLISPLLFLCSSVMINIENAFHKFFTQALAPIFYNLGILFGISYLSQDFGIIGVAYGVLIGAFLQMIIQIPSFIRINWSWHKILLTGEDLRNFKKHLLPRIISVSLLNLSVLVNIILAGLLTSGSISLYSLAFNLQSITVGLISISIAIPAFSYFTKYQAQHKNQAIKKRLEKDFEQTYFWFIPANLGLFLTAPLIIDFLFNYGVFNSPQELIIITKYFAIGMIFSATVVLLSRLLLAQEKTWLLAKISMVIFIIDIIISYYLSQKIGVLGLVWGTIIALSIQQITLVVYSWKVIGKFINFTKLLIIIFSSLLMFIILHNTMHHIDHLYSLLQIIILSITGLTIYLASYHFFNFRSL